MNELLKAKFIKSSEDFGDICPIFKKEFNIDKKIKKATLYISSIGIYEAYLNGSRIGEYIFAPGWTVYNKRLQYQEYDITEQIGGSNELTVTVGKGWAVGTMGFECKTCNWGKNSSLIANIKLEFADSSIQNIITDENWLAAKSNILFSEIYHGEIYDANIVPSEFKNAVEEIHSKDILIPQEGKIIKEIEEVRPVKYFVTPKGERVIDFGQNLTGYVKFKLNGNGGEIYELSHAEVLDAQGNFYTENLRTAKQHIKVISGTKAEFYKPHFTFQGFRFIRLDTWPDIIDLNDITAVVVHSDIKRTGYFECSNELVNKLFKNIIWGQKGNFLDIPSDCPQRDERLGWTGDAQVFIRAASYNFNVDKFYTKWLHDLKADQNEDGGIPHVIPNVLTDRGNSAGWADASVICPWQIYLTYDNKELLSEQYECMTKWINYIKNQGDNEYLWMGGEHFGDWLGLDAPSGSYTGSTSKDLIATAFCAYSTSLVIKAGKVLCKDVTEYERLHKGIVSAFKSEFIKDGKLTSDTQTAHVLALQFNLADNKEDILKRLVELIEQNGNKLTTGFIGTPYLLHALTNNGRADLAYTLLLQEEYPSWLYPVKMGATTMWEHWDGIKPDGSMWSKDMNSFNHYAYGAVGDWMYGVMAGINTDENNPGFKNIIFKPITDDRISYVKASIDTKYGKVSSEWKRENDKVVYSFGVPDGCTADIYVNGELHRVGSGSFIF